MRREEIASSQPELLSRSCLGVGVGVGVGVGFGVVPPSTWQRRDARILCLSSLEPVNRNTAASAPDVICACRQRGVGYIRVGSARLAVRPFVPISNTERRATASARNSRGRAGQELGEKCQVKPRGQAPEKIRESPVYSPPRIRLTGLVNPRLSLERSSFRRSLPFLDPAALPEPRGFPRTIRKRKNVYIQKRRKKKENYTPDIRDCGLKFHKFLKLFIQYETCMIIYSINQIFQVI